MATRVDISQVFIDESSDKTLTGCIDYDRANGGKLLPPRGTSFPTPEFLDEIFLKLPENIIFRWDGAQWVETEAAPSTHASTHVSGGSDQIAGEDLEVTLTAAPTNFTPTGSTLEGIIEGIDTALTPTPVIFGQAYQSSVVPALVTTVSTAFLQHNSLTATVTEPGDYLLLWSYAWNHDSTGNDFIARIQQDNTTPNLMDHRQEPKDSAGTLAASGTNQIHRAAGQILLNGLTAGSYVFDIDFTTQNGGVESSMADSKLIFFRVA